jgi:hypothetical protein
MSNQVKYVSEAFEARESVLPWQAAGRTWTASGYGSKIASRYMVRLEGETRWRRVYSTCYSNSATYWIVRGGAAFHVIPGAALEAALERAGVR